MKIKERMSVFEVSVRCAFLKWAVKEMRKTKICGDHQRGLYSSQWCCSSVSPCHSQGLYFLVVHRGSTTLWTFSRKVSFHHKPQRGFRHPFFLFDLSNQRARSQHDSAWPRKFPDFTRPTGWKMTWRKKPLARLKLVSG